MTTKTSPPSRPLSPFMLGQYYRFQWTSLLSFIHRITGMGLSAGTLLVALWLIAVAAGPQWYGLIEPHLKAWYGQIVIAAWTWSLMYHLGNGIRHLFWDFGLGFDLKTAERSGYLVVVASLVLTAGAWLVACSG